MSEETIRVLMVDDHAMVREGLAALISVDPLIEVVGQCGDGLKVVKMALELRPDVVLLDIGMPGFNGLDLCRELTRKLPATVVLILTMHDDDEFVARALDYGASGYLVKEAAADQLREAIHCVMAGQLYLQPGLSRGLLAQISRTRADPYDRLTPRERQVFQMIAEGKTTRQIAEKLGTAMKTVDTHRTRLMRKLGLHNINALVRYALKKGIVRLR
ncbi:MAG TPA: response regulator transcription factor [Phycisphaerae bacterium]|nr:response regulator transcription factor [Phycisphaerae bacterium]